jgi:uncharacterized membrane protein
MTSFTWAKPSDKAGVLVWVSWLTLLMVQVFDAWSTQVPWIIWLGKIVPLLIFIPGMLKENLRSYIWMCFVSLLYFLVLVERCHVVCALAGTRTTGRLRNTFSNWRSGK